MVDPTRATNIWTDTLSETYLQDRCCGSFLSNVIYFLRCEHGCENIQ